MMTLEQRKWNHPVHREIYERIKEYREVFGDAWREEYFNNFRLLMPRLGEFCWRFDEQYLDRPYVSPRGRERGQHSELLSSQTTRQFRDTIQRVIEEVGTTQEELTDAVCQSKGVRHAFKIFFPIYLKLREMGYCESELQG